MPDIVVKFLMELFLWMWDCGVYLTKKQNIFTLLVHHLTAFSVFTKEITYFLSLSYQLVEPGILRIYSTAGINKYL